MIKFLCLGLSLFLVQVSGHGMMLGPPNRSSLWRFDDTAPINYNDNENFCGGINALWQVNKGKCGVCGDVYTAPHPQPNENTGTYGTGKIVAEYKAGEIIETNILLTANHKGYFTYHLCELKDPSKPESGEDCFQQLKLADGSITFTVAPGIKEFKNKVQLPAGFTCKHCVLRWHYKGGNNWGTCDDGSDREGCGPQEVFRSCADISIV